MKKSFLFAFVLTAAGAAGVSAAVLTQVPVQNYGGDTSMWMLMPMAAPQLTPLLASNPGDSFDPADPWFNALNPSRQGASFSRRYGFDMDTGTDFLPANSQIWIRKLAGPVDLKFYRYSESAPRSLTPVFGTDGTTNALYWSGMMFHPLVSASPGTNGCTVTFEVYLVDTTTGAEVANSSSGPLVFNWTNASDGRPVLNLAQKIVVAWPAATTTNWVLESAATVNATAWNSVTNSPVTVDGQPAVVLDPNAAQQYFRLRFVP